MKWVIVKAGFTIKGKLCYPEEVETEVEHLKDFGYGDDEIIVKPEEFL